METSVINLLAIIETEAKQPRWTTEADLGSVTSIAVLKAAVRTNPNMLFGDLIRKLNSNPS
jgi:hypothetical protein